MRKVLILDGVSLPGATGKPVVTLTPADRAMAHIPGWVCYFDPDYIVDGNARNMALPDNITQNNGTPNTATTFPGGAAAFDVPDARHIRPNVAFPREAWSVFAVIRPSFSVVPQHLVGTTTPPEGEAVSPEMGFTANATTARIWSNGISTTRASYSPPTTFEDRTTLIMFTGSTRDGLRIYENGVEVASEPGDTAAIDAGYEPGEWRFLNGVRGLVGNFGLLSIDLGWAEHAGYRRSIERFLMDKYGIS